MDGIKPDIGLIRLTHAEQRSSSLAGAAGQPSTKAVAPHSQTEAKEAATQFEALLLQQMLNAMWQNVPQDSLFGTDQAELYYRDMLNEALAGQIARDQSLGISDQIMKEFGKIDDESKGTIKP